MYLYHYCVIQGSNHHSGTIEVVYEVNTRERYMAVCDEIERNLGTKDIAILSLSFLGNSDNDD